MKRIALLSLLLLVFSLGCASMDKTQSTLQALDGKWLIDTTQPDQEDLDGLFMDFDVKQNRALLGFEPDDEKLPLAFKVGEFKETSLALEMWPMDEPEDAKVLLFSVDNDKMVMADGENPEEMFFFIRAGK